MVLEVHYARFQIDTRESLLQESKHHRGFPGGAEADHVFTWTVKEGSACGKVVYGVVEY